MKKHVYHCNRCKGMTVVVDHHETTMPDEIVCGNEDGCQTGEAWLDKRPWPDTVVASHETTEDGEIRRKGAA